MPGDYSGNAVNSPIKKVQRIDLKAKGITRSNSGSIDGRNLPFTEPS